MGGTSHVSARKITRLSSKNIGMHKRCTILQTWRLDSNRCHGHKNAASANSPAFVSENYCRLYL